MKRKQVWRHSLSSLFLLLITLHWGFATGSLIAYKTDMSIPKFILICLLIRYFFLSYGI